MAKETVGYRRLYDAIGCSLADAMEFRESFPVRPPFSAEVYLGPKPRFGISLHQMGDGFIVPGEMNVLLTAEHQSDASQSSYPRHFFTEICCSLEVDAPDELSARFRQKDSTAQDEVLLFVQQHEEDFHNVVDFLAGVIGLKFHRQFVVKLVCENFFALRDVDGPVIQTFGPWAEQLDALSLNPQGAANLTHILKRCGAADGALQEFAGDVLRWVVRAWSERDSVSRFLSFFLPLEMVLQGIGNKEPAPEWAAIRELVSQHAADEQRAPLLALLERIKMLDRPSLNQRFETMARESGHAGWESDVKAFRKFNSLRNGLVHRGDPRVRFHITVGDNEAAEMGDLVERYVSQRFFGEMAVYPSRWRVRRSTPPLTAETAPAPDATTSPSQDPQAP